MQTCLWFWALFFSDNIRELGHGKIVPNPSVQTPCSTFLRFFNGSWFKLFNDWFIYTSIFRLDFRIHYLFLAMLSMFYVTMYSRDLLEIWRILWRHEEALQGNNIDLRSIFVSVHDNEKHYASGNANILNLLVQKRQKIDELEV